MAARAGLDLASIPGTGVGGRVTASDVRRRTAPRAATPTAARPTLSVEQPSFWMRNGQRGTVAIDVYSLNPLLDDLRQSRPDVLDRATSALGAGPTVFATGDLPWLLTSGADPQLLLQLPYVVRHAAASASASDLGELLETFSPPSQETWDYALQQHCLDQGVLLYERRMLAWAGDLNV